MKQLCLTILAVSATTLSGCGYSLVKQDSVEIVPVVVHRPDITLTDVRTAYKDSNVEVYDLAQSPSAYASQRVVMAPPVRHTLNKDIPVKDRSVEIYDIGFVPMNSGAAPMPVTKLSPPSDARESFTSPFYVIEEDGMLTDPLREEQTTQTSVIVPPSQEDDGEFELMTGF